jgi:hypothetical protein
MYTHHIIIIAPTFSTKICSPLWRCAEGHGTDVQHIHIYGTRATFCEWQEGHVHCMLSSHMSTKLINVKTMHAVFNKMTADGTEDRMMLLSCFLQWSNEKFTPFCKQEEISASKMWCSIAGEGTHPFNLAVDCTYHGQSEKFTPLCKRQKVVLSAVSELVLYDRMNFVR